jgi:3-hydroxyisobutyrate dehydrogenase
MAKIAFFGLGRMGSGMAARLRDAGHEVRVWNRTPKNEPGFVAKIEDAAKDADAAFAMLADDAASRDVWDRALPVLPKGAFVAECSTLSHDRVLELAAQAKAKGLRYIDSPVTGLPDVAAAGKLTLFVGADQEDLDAARPLLAPLSAEIAHFGPVGAGTVYKLMINLMGAVQIAAVGEGLSLAAKAGLDVAQVAAYLAKGQAASPQAVRAANRIVAGDHDRDVLFTGRLRLKDASYGAALARKLDIPARLGETACDAYSRLVDAGLGDQNETKIVAVSENKL